MGISRKTSSSPSISTNNSTTSISTSPSSILISTSTSPTSMSTSPGTSTSTTSVTASSDDGCGHKRSYEHLPDTSTTAAKSQRTVVEQNSTGDDHIVKTYGLNFSSMPNMYLIYQWYILFVAFSFTCVVTHPNLLLEILSHNVMQVLINTVLSVKCW